MTKTRVNSAIISKRSLNPLGTPNRNLPINSPLITNKGLNSLSKIAKEKTEVNKMSTPSMPSRSVPMDLSSPSGSILMNKIVRRDLDRDNPPTVPSLTKKPPLPVEPKMKIPKKEDSDVKPESKNNTTMETTPNISERSLIKSVQSQKESVKRDSQKYESNLKAFEQIVPEGSFQFSSYRSKINHIRCKNSELYSRDQQEEVE